MGKLEKRHFISSTGIEGEIDIPLADWSLPENLRESLLSLIREAKELMEDSPEFKSWEKFCDTSINYKEYKQRKKLFLNNISAGVYFELCVYEDNIDDLLKDPAYYYNLRNFVSALKENAPIGSNRTEIIESVLPPYFKTSRGITTLSTRPRKRGKNLYSLLTDEEDIKTAKELEEKGKLLSTLTSGIVVSALENKVIKAIQKHLYAQSKGYDRGEGDGLPEDIIRANIGKDYDNDEKLRDSSFVCLEPYKLTREVLGIEERGDVGGADVKRVMGALSSLDGKFAYDDNEKAYYRLFTIEKIKARTDDGAGQIFVACRPIFKEGLKNSFINTRADELQLLSGISSDLSLRLYDILKELDSYNTPTQRTMGYIQMGKIALIERIAVKKSYDSQRRRIETDFASAVEDMIKIGIITKATEVGNNIRFYISNNWRKGADESETDTSQEGKV